MERCADCELDLTEQDRMGAVYVCPGCRSVVRPQGTSSPKAPGHTAPSRMCTRCEAIRDDTRTYTWWGARDVSVRTEGDATVTDYVGLTEMSGAVCRGCVARRARVTLVWLAALAVPTALGWGWWARSVSGSDGFIFLFLIPGVLAIPSLGILGRLLRSLAILTGGHANTIGAEILIEQHRASGRSDRYKYTYAVKPALGERGEHDLLSILVDVFLGR